MKKYLVILTDSIKSMIAFARKPENVAATNSVPALKTGIDSAESEVALIDALAAMQKQNITGYAEAKLSLKKMAALITMTIVGPARAYYLNQKDKVMVKKLTVTYSSLYKTKDGELSGFCAELYNTILPLLPQFATYGITQPMMDSWNTAIMQYRAIVSDPRVAIANRKVETIDLEKMVIDLNEFCRTTLSSMVEVFRQSNPTYYAKFHESIKQIERGHHYTRLECICTMGDTGSVVPNAKVTVDGTSLTATTNEQGMCTLAPIPRTAKSISITAVGYTPVSAMAVKFMNGETNRITVQMQMLTNIKSNTAVPVNETAN